MLCIYYLIGSLELAFGLIVAIRTCASVGSIHGKTQKELALAHSASHNSSKKAGKRRVEMREGTQRPVG